MAKNVNNNDTLEVLRTSYNELVDEVGGLGGLRTSQKGSLVDSINSIIDQYFFFQDFEFDGSDGSSSNRTFSGADNLGNTLKYSTGRLLVFKNGLLLRNGTDYSATNGSSITLVSSAANSDIIRITSFTGSYEGVAGATQGAVTQWTKTGAGSIYNHDTTGGVVINSDATGIVTAPASGVGVQIESDGSNIFLNTGSTSNKVEVNGNINLVTGGKLTVNDGNVALNNFQGLQDAVRAAFSGGTGIAYNSSTGTIAATGSADTTGNAATATALQNARTIHGVSFDGTANIDLTEQIQDTVNGVLVAGTNMSLSYDDAANTLTISSSGKTQEEVEDIVGAMFSSNTETGITVTYEDSDGTLDLVIGNGAIVSSMIAANTIVGGNIAANSIGSSEIAPNAINASELADDSVDTDAIVNNAVTLGTKTSGNYVGTLVGGTGLSSTGATSGEGIAHTINLDNTAVSAGSYGSATAIPTFTVDAQGRLTAASQVSVDTYSGFEFGTSSSDKGTVNETENVFITAAGSLNAEHTESSGTHTLALTIDDATTSAKGVASFSSTDFNVSSGAVSFNQESIEDIVGAMFDGNGAGATTVSYNDGTGTITVSSTDNNTQLSTADVRSKISGTGLISYNSSTGVISTTANNYSLPSGNVTGASVSGSTLTLTRQGAGDITFTDTNTNTTYTASDFNILSLSGYNSSTSNYLRGDGQWVTPPDTNTTYTASSFMSTTLPDIAARFSSLGVGANASGTTGKIDAGNDIVAFSSSDMALKENINPITNALDKVMSLGGYTFNWKKDRDTEHGYGNSSDVGILAQEVESVLPTAVRKNNYGNKAVRYEKLIPLLLESIKELKSEIESLKS